MRKLMSTMLALAFVAVLGMSVAAADPFTDCVNACADQYAEDKAACDQALADTLAQLDADSDQCFVDYANDPFGLFNCLRIIERQRQIAANDHNDCMSAANTAGWNCYRDCQSSPSAP